MKADDRVKCIKPFSGRGDIVGKIGTVVDTTTYTDDHWVGVDFDDWFGGHNCSGKARECHGYYGCADCLEPLFEKVDLPPEFAYVARDKDGLLFGYCDKPKRDVGGTQWYGERFKKINDDLLPDLKWEDEPYEVCR